MSRRRLSAGVAADLAAAREQNASEGVPRPDRPKLRGSTAPSPMRPRQGVVLSKQAREPTVSPKRRRVDSPNRRILTRAHTGPVFQKEQVRQPLARVNTVAGGRVSVAQPSLRHGIKDISIKNVSQAPLKPIEEQENVPPDGNRVSVGSLDSVCLSDGQEVVDLGDGHVRDSFLSQEEQFYEDYQDSPSPILQQQQMSPEAFSYRPHSQQGVYPDRGSSARSMAPTVDLANSAPEPSAWEYSFAAPGDQSVAATIYSQRTSVAGDDELAQTQWQASQRLPSSQVHPAGQQHTSPEFGFRPYGKTGPVQNYRPSVQGHAAGAGSSAVSWETRPISGDSVSYAPFNGQTQAQSEVGEPDRGIHELEGYRSDTSQRAQPQQQQKPFTPTQVQMGGNTPRSEASCSSYYANLLDAAATQAAQQQARPEATTVPSHAALERATAPLASLASQAYQQRPLDTGQASYVMGAGSGPSGWRPSQIGPGTGSELHTMATDRVPGRDRLGDIPLSKEIVGTAEIAEKLGEIIGKHLPGDAYDYHIYVEAFNKVIESVRREYLTRANRVNLSASRQALLAFADNTMVAWREGSILDIFTKCKLLRRQARMELNFRGLVRPSQDTVSNVMSRVEALRDVVEGKRALLEKLRREKASSADRVCSTGDIIEREIESFKMASANEEEEAPLEPSYDLLFELGNRWIRMEFITEEERTRGEWEDPGDDFESFNVPTAETPDLSEVRSDEATPRQSRRVRESVGSVASMMAMECGLSEFAS